MFSLVPWKRERTSGALAQRDPFQLMRNEFENLFDRFFGELPLAFADGWHQGWGVDMEEKENEVVVRAELPGFEVNDINMHLAENVMTIEAKHGTEEGKDKENGGREFRQVRRAFTLPAGMDSEKVEASYRNGILEIHVPRSPQAQPRKIEIKG